MFGKLQYQPQQHTSKSQRWRTTLPRPPLGLRHDCGMQPHPHMAQHQRHAPKQQTPDWGAAARADAGLMRLPKGTNDEGHPKKGEKSNDDAQDRDP
jgi:hypothetical protein